MKEIRNGNVQIIPRAEQKDGLCVVTEFYQTPEGEVVHISIENIGGQDVQLHEISLFREIRIYKKYDKTYSECRDLLGEVGINDAHCVRISYGVLGYTDEMGTDAVLFGFDDFQDYFYKFVSKPTDDGFELSVYCDFQGAYLARGQKAKLSDLRICFSDSVSGLLQEHAHNILKKMSAQSEIKNSLGTGWCSWYYYYGTENKEDIFENIRQIKAAEIGRNADFILIDDGWNQKENNVCVWGDWTAGCKFPEGMKAVCDKIHANDLKAGIWLAPFAVSRNSELFAAHPDWILAGKEDILNPNEGVFGLDLSNPEVLQYLRETFTRIFDEWEFDIVKIDFLLYGAGEGKRFDKYCTGVQAFRKGLKTIRECAGGKIVLNCGSPVLQSVGLCDAMRIGSDVGSRWYFPLNEPAWPYGNCSIKCSTRYTVYRNWMNRAFWINDPDCIIVRDRSNGVEYKQFCSFFPYMQIEEKDFGLSDNEAELWIKLVAFTGGVKYLSEKWNDLPESRKQLVCTYLTKQFSGCTLVDYYKHQDLYVLKGNDGQSVAVFNVSDEDIDLRVPVKNMRGADTLTETESGSPIVRQGDMYVFPTIKARTGYIFQNHYGIY